jgi:hypothetical protein
LDGEGGIARKEECFGINHGKNLSELIWKSKDNQIFLILHPQVGTTTISKPGARIGKGKCSPWNHFP